MGSSEENQPQEIGVDSIYDTDESFDPRQAVTILAHERESDKYVVKQKIGEGAMGEVYRVFDQDLQRTNVIKVIRPEIEQNRQQFLSFIREAQITGQLEHPNIIPVHSVGIIEDKVYFSMKEIEGGSLDELLERIRVGEDKHYNIYALLTLFRKVCDGIAFAHSRGIIHRDIKPENIMVGHFGEVLVVDWGLARDLKSDTDEASPDNVPLPEGLDITLHRQMTQYGDIKGSPAYMSPEQAHGCVDEIDHRSDIFLLGSTLYGIATLTPPYVGDTLREVIENAQEVRFDEPQVRAPTLNLPPELCRIILRAMAPLPDDRYQSVEDLATDIDDLLAGNTASDQRVFSPGEFLMSEGEVAEEAYVITKGKVQVLKTVGDQLVPLVELGEGNAVGEMALISDAPRSATVRAVVETATIVITKDTISRGLDKLPMWMGQVIETLVDRLRATNTVVHPLATSNCSCHVLNQLLLFAAAHGRKVSGTVVLDLGRTVEQIANSLCLSVDRVAPVISVAAENGPLLMRDSQLYIADTDRLVAVVAELGDRFDVDLGLNPEARLTSADMDVIERLTEL